MLPNTHDAIVDDWKTNAQSHDNENFPHTDKEGFVFSTITRANSALVCPAAFAIVEEMKERLG